MRLRFRRDPKPSRLMGLRFVGASKLMNAFHLTNMMTVSNDSPHDIADCACVQAHLSCDVLVHHSLFGHFNNASVARRHATTSREPRAGTYKRLIGLLGLDSKVWANHVKHTIGVRIVPNAPVVFWLPLSAIVDGFIDYANTKAALDTLDNGPFRACDRYIDTNFREMNTTLSIEETGKPAGKLIVGHMAEHILSWVTLVRLYYTSNSTKVQGVPLPMGRAIAKAVKEALEVL